MKYLIFLLLFVPFISVSAQEPVYWCGSGERFSTQEEAQKSLTDSFDRARQPLVEYLTELQGKYDGFSTERNSLNAELISAKKISAFVYFFLIVSVFFNGWFLYIKYRK